MKAVTGVVSDVPAGAVALAVDGDEAAFVRIVEAHHADMVRVCFVISGNLDSADEAAQAAWVVAWRKLDRLRDTSRLRSWLIAIAANEARQLVRRERRRVIVELTVGDGGASSADPSARPEDLDLSNALARLSPDDRALLALRYVAGFDSFELANATGRSASGTRARLARLLDRLRTELHDD